MNIGGLGISSITNYCMNQISQQNRVAQRNNNTDFNGVLSAKRNENIENISASQVDTYREYLEEKYGNIRVQDVGTDQKSMDSLGSGTVGMNNIVIAPNILEEMANDPEKAAYYEKKIQYLFDSQPIHEAQLAANGFQIQSRGMVIHPDGTVNYYICGDVSPEKKAKIEAAMKAEDEEKAKRKKMYLERSKESADRQKKIADINEEKRISDVLNQNIMNYVGIGVFNGLPMHHMMGNVPIHGN